MSASLDSHSKNGNGRKYSDTYGLSVWVRILCTKIGNISMQVRRVTREKFLAHFCGFAPHGESGFLVMEVRFPRKEK